MTDKVEVNTDVFCKEFKGFIPVEILKMVFDENFHKREVLLIEREVIEAIASEKREYQNREKEYSEVGSLRLQGMELEERGDIEGAISAFAASIQKGEESRYNLFAAYAHSYARIFILLRKVNDILQEKEYLEKYLTHSLTESERAKYSKRLATLLKKLK